MERLIILILVISFSQSYAQDINDRDRFSVNKIQNVLNMENETVDLEMLSGKSILLDFGGLRCPPCIASVKKLDKLLHQYNNALEVFFVTKTKKQDLIDFFENKVPVNYVKVVYEDSILNSLFPHRGEPHLVWIDSQMRVRYITEGDIVSETFINDFLTEKIDYRIPRKLGLIYDPTESAIWPRNNSGFDNRDFLKTNYALIGRYKEGYRWKQYRLVDSLTGSLRVGGINVPILRMYRTILGLPNLSRSRVICQGFPYDRLEHFDNALPLSLWDMDNTYFYEVRGQLSMGVREFQKYAMNNFDAFMGWSSDFRKLDRRSYVIKRIGSYGKEIIPKTSPVGSKTLLDWTNVADDIYAGIPVVIEEGLDRRELYRIKVVDDFNPRNKDHVKQLEAHGITLELQVVPVETLVIKKEEL